MKSLMYTILLSAQLASILGSTPWLTFQNKCWVLDSPCLTTKVQALVPTVTGGISRLGIEKLDTMLVDQAGVDEEFLKFSFNNLQVKGLKDAIIDNVSVDMVSRVARVLFHTDMFVSSQYIGKGYLFSLPVLGEGDLTMKMKNVQIEMLMPFDIVKDSNGEDVMDLKGFQYLYDVKDNARYEFGNLYYGDKIASETMHHLINENWKILTIEYGRSLFYPVTAKIFNAMRSYMLSRPMSDIFVLSSDFQ